MGSRQSPAWSFVYDQHCFKQSLNLENKKPNMFSDYPQISNNKDLYLK